MNRARHKYCPVSSIDAERHRQKALAAERARLDVALFEKDPRAEKSARNMITYLEGRAPTPRHTPPTE